MTKNKSNKSRKLIAYAILMNISTPLYAVVVPPNSVNTVTINSLDTDLTVDVGGNVTVPGGAAVEANFDADDLALSIENNDTLSSGNAATGTITATGAGTNGSLTIRNTATITNTANGSPVNFTGTSNPITLIQDGAAATLTGNQINLTTGANGSVTLQLGTPLAGTATLATPILGDANTTIDIQNVYNHTSPTGSITSAGHIILSQATSNLTTSSNITDFLTFTTVAGSTMVQGANTVSSHLGGQFLNSGNFTLNAQTMNLTSGSFVNETTGTATLNGGNWIANTVNNGIFDANHIFHSSVNTFINNNVFNVNLDSLVNAGFRIFSNNVDVSVLNLNPPSQTFTTTNIITSGRINLLAPATTFNIGHAISSLATLQMDAGMTTNVNANGSITTPLLTLSNQGTLRMNGGTLNGNVVGNQNTTFSVASDFTTNGTISGFGNITATGGNFTIGHAVSNYNTFQNSATVTMNGGTLSAGINGGGAGSNLIIARDFTTAGIMGANQSLDTTTINNGAILTMNHSINSTNSTNNGELALSSAQILTGNYLQPAGGSLVSTLNNTGNFGQLTVNGNATVGGTIHVIPLNNGAGIRDQDRFDVVTATALIDNNPSVTAASNFFLTFTRDTSAGVPLNTIRLIANRASFNSFTTNTPSIGGVASALDSVPQNTGGALGTVLSTLQQLTDAATLRSYLTQLIPDVSGATIQSSLAMNDLVVEKISSQVEERRASHGIAGYSAGDFLMENENGVAPFFFGNTIRQSRAEDINGYRSTTGGFGVLADAAINRCTNVGGALSYGRSNIKDFNFGNRTTIDNFQGALFGDLDFNSSFLTGMVSFGVNQYNTLRNITFLDTYAKGHFMGFQSNGMLKGGLNIPLNNLKVSPFGLVHYTRLAQRKYNETGSGPTLQVNSQTENVVRTGAGIKIMELVNSGIFDPEIHGMVLYDTKRANLQSTSTFTGGGPAFMTIGKPIPRMAYNVGLSASLKIHKDLRLIGKYDLETRKRLISNSASLFLKYLF